MAQSVTLTQSTVTVKYPGLGFVVWSVYNTRRREVTEQREAGEEQFRLNKRNKKTFLKGKKQSIRTRQVQSSRCSFDVSRRRSFLLLPAKKERESLASTAATLY